MHLRKLGISILGAIFFVSSNMSLADETCMSPYMAKIVGQEDYVYGKVNIFIIKYKQNCILLKTLHGLTKVL